MSILTQNFVLKAVEAERNGEKFSIVFNEAWKASGYTVKSNAVRAMKKRLKVNYDYRCSDRSNVLLADEYYLTVDGFKFFLAKADTEEGDATLWYFIEIEKAYRADLELKLRASFAPNQPDNTRYSITFWKVHQDSGIVDPWYVRNVILAKYDHRMVNDLICVTQKTYEDLLENFRSQAGTDISNLPPEKQAKFKRGEASKKNRREPQQRDDGQLNLF